MRPGQGIWRGRLWRDASRSTDKHQLDTRFRRCNIPSAEWEVEYTDEFGTWFESLTEPEQEDIAAVVGALERGGPALGRPYVDTVSGSRHAHMKELRVQHRGHPYRILFAFDPRRCAILLIGGDKTGNERWYEEHVPVADWLYDERLETLRREAQRRGGIG